ncbi:MAG: tol-pal system YbgF family protein [Lentimicrobium sp.]
MKKLSLFILIILIISCKTDTIQKDNKQFISINITGKAIFSNDTIGIEDFMFSPVDSNAIWIFNTNGPSYELKLTDSSWSKLDKKFGIYSYGLKKHNIHRDTVESELIWISNFHKGLIAYNIEKDTLFEFKALQPISSICFLKNAVIIGTWSGLFKIDRVQKEVVKSESIAEISIGKIEKINENILLINNKFEYNYRTDKILKIREEDKNSYLKKVINGFTVTGYNDNSVTISKENFKKAFNYPEYLFDNIIVDDETIWIPFKNLKSGIIKFDYSRKLTDTILIGYDFHNYKLYDESDNIWFYNDLSILCFNKKNGSTYQLQQKVNNLIADSKYVYVNTWNSVEIYEKLYLLQNSTDIKISLIEEDRFKALVDSLGIYNINGFKGYYSSFRILNSRFCNSTNKRILQRLDGFKVSLIWQLPYDFEQLRGIERYIIDSVENKAIKASYYLHAIKVSNHNGKLKESLKFDSVLKMNYPDSRTEYHIKRMSEVSKSYKLIKTIHSSNLPEDLKLWKLGKSYYDLFRYVGPETEGSTMNMSYPFTYLESLLKNYPTSNYADDAEFLMLSHVEGTYEGGDISYNLIVIEKYKAMLKKYPATEFAPDIYYIICGLYYYSEPSFEEKPKYYKLALDYADKIVSEYPSFAKEKNVAELKNSIKKSISEVLWNLNIKSDKTDYKPDEPVVITFNLKNIDNRSKSIQLLKDNRVPNFSLWIKRYPFDEHATSYEIIRLERATESYNKEKIDTLIGQNQTYSETWNIERNARDSFTDAPGKFTLNETGRYKINAYGSENYFDHSIPSNTIWINVNDH